jgi:hypothetical protein
VGSRTFASLPRWPTPTPSRPLPLPSPPRPATQPQPAGVPRDPVANGDGITRAFALPVAAGASRAHDRRRDQPARAGLRGDHLLWQRSVLAERRWPSGKSTVTPIPSKCEFVHKRGECLPSGEGDLFLAIRAALAAHPLPPETAYPPQLLRRGAMWRCGDVAMWRWADWHAR